MRRTPTPKVRTLTRSDRQFRRFPLPITVTVPPSIGWSLHSSRTPVHTHISSRRRRVPLAHGSGLDHCPYAEADPMTLAPSAIENRAPSSSDSVGPTSSEVSACTDLQLLWIGVPSVHETDTYVTEGLSLHPISVRSLCFIS